MDGQILAVGDSKDLNVHEVPCSTADKFLDAISPRSEHLRFREKPRVWLFRGHGCDTWKLVPSALRGDGRMEELTGGQTTIDTNREQIKAEIELLTAFFYEADASGLRLPEDSQEMRKKLWELSKESYFEKLAAGDAIWPPYSMYSLFALMQHHGLPTRLLDWTFDSKIAAYFAAESAARHVVGGSDRSLSGSKCLAVWAMARDAFFQYREDESENGNRIPTVEVAAPLAEIPNLRAQRGVFLLNRPIRLELDDALDDRPLDRVLRGKATDIIDHPIFTKYNGREFSGA